MTEVTCELKSATLGNRMWAFLALPSLLGVVVFFLAGFRFSTDFLHGHHGYLLWGTIGVAACITGYRLPALRRFAELFGPVLMIMAVMSAGMMLAFSSATVGRPLVDATLLHIDQMLGYDWKTYHALITHSWFADYTPLAYATFGFQPMAVIAALWLAGRQQRIEVFVFAICIGFYTTSCIFTLFPATTAWHHLGITGNELAQYRYGLPPGTDGWVDDLLGVRDGSVRLFTQNFSSGIIAFPSFHTCVAILYVWAAWPVRSMRPVMLLVNGAMLVATPIMGGHYLIDMIGGTLVALSAIVLAPRVHKWCREMGSNHRRVAFQATALPLSYLGT